MKRGAEHHLFREDATSGGIHAWLREHYPKAGVCEECGGAGKTHYAFLPGVTPHWVVRRRDAA